MSVSVIIPIYNKAQYLDRCIKSVTQQSYKDLDIILVDDGSTDNSLEVCQSVAKKDARIKVIHKENSGSADARNRGIKSAQGEYLLFLDSDDYYTDADAIKVLVKTAQDYSSDVVLFNYCRNDGKAVISAKDSLVTDLKQIISGNIYTSSACVKLIHSRLLKENNILFEKGRLSEDILFCGLLLKNAKNIVFINKVYYNYTVREGSITKSIKAKNIRDVLHAVERLEKYDGYLVRQYTAFQYATILINMNLCTEVLEKELVDKIYSKKYLLKNNAVTQVKNIYISSKLIGIKNTSKLLTSYFKFIN